jgi:hypothetical protein
MVRISHSWALGQAYMQCFVVTVSSIWLSSSGSSASGPTGLFAVLLLSLSGVSQQILTHPARRATQGDASAMSMQPPRCRRVRRRSGSGSGQRGEH